MIVSTEQAPAAIGPYSQAVIAQGFVFCSGQISLTPDGEGPVGETAAEQTEQIMKNIEAVLEAAGSNLERVVKTTIFLLDMQDFQAVNEVYASRFPQNPPARSTVAVSALPRKARVEIEVIATA